MSQEPATTDTMNGSITNNVSVVDANLLMYAFHPNKARMTLVFGTIGVIGLLGNLLVVVVIFRYTKNFAKKVTSIYIINQSFIDLVVAVLILLAAFIDSRFLPADDGVWAQIYCRVWLTQALQWGFIRSSTTNLMLLSIERYIAVVHPIRYKTSFTRKKVTSSLVLVWLLGILYMVIANILVSGAVDGRCYPTAFWPSKQFRVIYSVANISIVMMCPLILHVFCYGRILYTLHCRSQPPVSAVFTLDRLTSPDVHTIRSASTSSHGLHACLSVGNFKHVAKATKNVTQTLSIVTLCYVICFLPHQVRVLLFHIGGLGECGLCWLIPVTLVFAHCCINPFIYTARYVEFQEGLRSLALHLRLTCDTANDNSHL